MTAGLWRIASTTQKSAGQREKQMTLKIQRSAAEEETVFRLSGRIEQEQLPELQRLFKAEPERHSIIIDLTDVKLVDRGAVKFLEICETGGMKLENCPAYIREWIVRERR